MDGSFVATLLETGAIGVLYMAWKAITEGKSISFASFGLWGFFVTYLLTSFLPLFYNRIMGWWISSKLSDPCHTLCFALPPSPSTFAHSYVFVCRITSLFWSLELLVDRRFIVIYFFSCNFKDGLYIFMYLTEANQHLRNLQLHCLPGKKTRKGFALCLKSNLNDALDFPFPSHLYQCKPLTNLELYRNQRCLGPFEVCFPSISLFIFI